MPTVVHDSVSVVITAYNRGWCVARAVTSCLAQSAAVDEIIVVDDCSTDNTEAVIRGLITSDPRIRYLRTEKNGGHLAALRHGIEHAASDWIALLDSDDELPPKSIEARIVAAMEYNEATGVKAQLVYGDLETVKFARLKGYVFPYLCKELCLCQTSTIMLGRECLSHFPLNNPFNTDDEIVLAVGKHFHVLHSGAVVAIYHSHDSPIRMANNARKAFEGVCELVRDHRADIVREHGKRRLLLWRVRILKAFINYNIVLVNTKISALQLTITDRCQRAILRLYRMSLVLLRLLLTSFLKRHFQYDYF